MTSSVACVYRRLFTTSFQKDRMFSGLLDIYLIFKYKRNDEGTVADLVMIFLTDHMAAASWTLLNSHARLNVVRKFRTETGTLETNRFVRLHSNLKVLLVPRSFFWDSFLNCLQIGRLANTCGDPNPHRTSHELKAGPEKNDEIYLIISSTKTYSKMITKTVSSTLIQTTKPATFDAVTFYSRQ